MRKDVYTKFDGAERRLDVFEPDDDRMEISDYAVWFDAACDSWTDDPEYNLLFLKTIQALFNVKLRVVGHVYLEEVYDMLRKDKNFIEDKKVGWIYDENNPLGDNFVDFRINSSYNHEFIVGNDPMVLLDFNVDGVIEDKIP